MCGAGMNKLGQTLGVHSKMGSREVVSMVNASNRQKLLMQGGQEVEDERVKEQEQQWYLLTSENCQGSLVNKCSRQRKTFQKPAGVL